TSPQLSAIRIGDSSSKQPDAMVGTPSLTQCFMPPSVSPSFITAPSATPDVEMPALAPGQKDRLGRVMIEPNGSSRPSVRLSSWLKKVQDTDQRLDWMLPYVFDDLPLYWNTNKFNGMSEQAKKARGSLKGGSLHTIGARTVGTITREMSGLEGIGSSHQAEELDDVQIAAMSAQIAQLTLALADLEQRGVAEQQNMSATVQEIKE
ncbi:hypothetical protein MTR67_018566, partial [Solanum verrucosum]